MVNTTDLKSVAEGLAGSTPVARTTLSCDGCRLCCKLMSVYELEKPCAVWCKYIDQRGCSIYADRPYGCRVWACGWLRSQTAPKPEDRMPLEMRPDKSHVLFSEGTTHMWVHVEPSRPDAWRKGKIGTMINGLVELGIKVLIAIGNKRILIEKGKYPRYLILPPDQRMAPKPMRKELEDE